MFLYSWTISNINFLLRYTIIYVFLLFFCNLASIFIFSLDLTLFSLFVIQLNFIMLAVLWFFLYQAYFEFVYRTYEVFYKLYPQSSRRFHWFFIWFIYPFLINVSGYLALIGPYISEQLPLAGWFNYICLLLILFSGIVVITFLTSGTLWFLKFYASLLLLPIYLSVLLLFYTYSGFSVPWFSFNFCTLLIVYFSWLIVCVI